MRASPLARRLARDKGVDLAGVAGSGPGGAVVAGDLADLADLERRAPTKEARPEPEPPRAPSPGSAEDRRAALRRSIGDLMARSKREIPHYYLSNTIDLRAATEWLSAANAGRPVSERILPAALLFRAVTLACASNPSMNGHWVDGELRHSDEVDLGVAISLRGGGLVAPTILGAESLGVDEIMARLNGLVERARAGRLLSSEMTDPTITITNLGDQGSEAVFGVIYPPQVALVGFGRIVERPWAVDGMLAVRPVVTATLAADHRASDGHDGARFLASIERLLQDPEKL